MKSRGRPRTLPSECIQNSAKWPSGQPDWYHELGWPDMITGQIRQNEMHDTRSLEWKSWNLSTVGGRARSRDKSLPGFPQPRSVRSFADRHMTSRSSALVDHSQRRMASTDG